MLSRIILAVAIPLILWCQTPAVSRDLHADQSAPAGDVSALPSSDRRWALIIGVDEYLDKQITPLTGAAADAHGLADAMVKYGGFQPDHVVLLASDLPPERQPTRGNILVKLSNIAGLVPKDGLLLFSFAGHGMERDGKAFLLPSDAKLSNDIRVVQETAVAAGSVRGWIADMKIKQVIVLLDACRNDPTAGRSAAPNNLTEAYTKAFSFDVRNRDIEAFATFYATKVGERAYLYSEKGHGYFTWALLEGLSGAAANSAGEVTLGSLRDYVQETVPKLVKLDLGADVDQRPFADINGFRADDLVIANATPRAGAAAADEARLAELKEWDQIAQSPDIHVFVDFRRKHPAGSLALEATRRIEQLAWQGARDKNEPAALRQFLTDYPTSPYTQQANDALRALMQMQADQQTIQDTLNRYAEAFSRKDLDQLRTLWPTLGSRDTRKFQDFFNMAKSIRMSLQPAGAPRITGDTAQVQCGRTLQFADERGFQPPAKDRITIRLRRTASSWAIDSIE